MDRENGIQSVNRALNLISLFTHGSPRLGITEISKALGLTKPTVHGLVRTLAKQGFLQQDPQTRKYGLGLKIYELGIVLAGSLDINQKGAGPAYQLAKRTGLVSRIAIWDMDSALLTVNIEPRSHLFFVHQIGPRIPAYASGIGKALLSCLEVGELESYLERINLDPYTENTIREKDRLRLEIEETRRRGYAIDREENVLGLACIGTPIFGQGGRLEASISISGEAKEVYERMETLAREVLNTSKEISRSMGYFPESLGLKP
ncbi:MAG: HTH-type transcriptional regulator KipR [Syntrophorhabdaceae bacterium PtaU1.Bin034]|jgi:DNA-binding IclR family transcriptional regulator|nr:MAG: HTH-type transcriptional regulator KipR [Syntrophorhabdaceae bacterium PtaU1.Bin034]